MRSNVCCSVSSGTISAHQLLQLFQAARAGGANAGNRHLHFFGYFDIARFLRREVKEFDEATASVRQPRQGLLEATLLLDKCNMVRKVRRVFNEMFGTAQYTIALSEPPRTSDEPHRQGL